MHCNILCIVITQTEAAKKLGLPHSRKYVRSDSHPSKPLKKIVKKLGYFEIIKCQVYVNKRKRKKEDNFLCMILFC